MDCEFCKNVDEKVSACAGHKMGSSTAWFGACSCAKKKSLNQEENEHKTFGDGCYQCGEQMEKETKPLNQKAHEHTDTYCGPPRNQEENKSWEEEFNWFFSGPIWFTGPMGELQRLNADMLKKEIQQQISFFYEKGKKEGREEHPDGWWQVRDK